MDINEPIPYSWNLGWNEGMVSLRPVVNQLLRATLEKNVAEMENLFQQGASLKRTHQETLQRVLYHVLDDYDVIACLVRHGLTSYNASLFKKSDYYLEDECWSPYGYGSGLTGRAWQLGANKVVKLLAVNGFQNMSFSVKDKFYEGEELCFEKNDVNTILIFLENGKPASNYELLCRKYPESKVTKYLESMPVIHRITALLDPCLFKKIPEPQIEKPGIFFRKAVKEKNEKLLKDYKDRIAAQKRYIDKIGYETWIKEVEKEEKTSEIFLDMAEELRKERIERLC